MRVRLTIVRLAVLLFVPCCALSCTAQGQLAGLQGNWVGGLMLDGNWVTLNVSFAGTPGSIDSRANISFTGYESQNGIGLTALAFEKNSRVGFDIPTSRGTFRFDGKLTGGTISGTYLYSQKRGRFGLTRVVQIDPAMRAKLFGAYRSSSGKIISIFEWVDGASLMFLDYESGQINTLYPLSETTFFSGSGRAVSYPVTLMATFVKDNAGEVTKLIWRFDKGSLKTATKIRFNEEQVSFRNGGITLGASLITPSSKGPHSVVIVVPGDFGNRREPLRLWAYNFLRAGVAALIMDSRGAGASTGPVASSRFEDLATDVLAAVDYLKTRENINPQQIGLFGFSNSAWTVTLAASRSRDVAFLINQSVSGLPPWQQETFRAERQVRLAGFSEDAVKNAAALMKLKFEVARTGTGWEELQALLDKYRNERWLPYTNPPASLERLKATWQRSFSYDPVPSFERLKSPVFLYFGDVDSNIPVQASIPVIEAALKRAGNKDYTIKIFPRGRHDLMEGVDGGPRESTRMRKYVPGYFDTMLNWLLKRVTVSGLS